MEDIVGYALVLAVAWFIISKIAEGYREQAQHCLTCGTEGVPKDETPGSLTIELILWLCFVIPGLIYSIWRMTTRHAVCSACSSRNIIPTDTPAAIAHRKALQQGQSGPR